MATGLLWSLCLLQDLPRSRRRVPGFGSGSEAKPSGPRAEKRSNEPINPRKGTHRNLQVKGGKPKIVYPK